MGFGGYRGWRFGVWGEGVIGLGFGGFCVLPIDIRFPPAFDSEVTLLWIPLVIILWNPSSKRNK